MGVVYETLDLERGDKIAMKTLLRSDGDALLRFKREFRSLQDIEHPNLVNLYELLEVEGEWFFTMELIDGVDFLSYVWRTEKPKRHSSQFDRAPTLPPPAGPGASALADELRLRNAIGQLTLGLAALHGAGKVHRDVKPSNALVTEDGRLVLLDLGLVADRQNHETDTGDHLLGTPGYMAPEQASGHYSPASDWYSVGVMLFHALAGQLPFSGSPFDILMQKQDEPAPPVDFFAPGTADYLVNLCAELLRRNPEKRPDARAILRRLDLSGMVDLATSSTSISMRQPFVGRDAELSAMAQAHADVAAGATVTVVLHGRSGVGKSALIGEFSRRARAAGTTAPPLVLVGRCYENESLSYNAFDGVIDELSAHLGSLAPEQAKSVLPADAALLVRAFPVLASVDVLARAQLLGDVKDPDELRTRMLAALREMFIRLSARNPVVITIDDVQWANRDSLLLLSEVLRPPDGPRLLMLISARGAKAPDIDLTGDVRHIAVEPLEQADARELAASLLVGVGLPSERAAAIATEAQGHPMHIDALIRYAIQAPEDDGRPKLDQAIVARMGQLPSEARRVLELICLAGAPVTRVVMARAALLEDGEFDRAFAVLRLHKLARASGVRRKDIVEPYHDRVRESVAAAIASETLVPYHAALATALESVGSDTELLLRHQTACGQTERAAATALRAAGAASDALAFDRSAELYQIALRLRPDADEERRQVQWQLSVALENAGRGDEAAASYLLAGDGADKATRLEAYRRAAEQWLKTGHIERGLDTLREILTQINSGYPTTPRRAMASLLWTRLRLRVRGLGFKPRDVSQLGREHLTRIDVFRSVGQGIGMVDTIKGAAFQAKGLVMALQSGEPTRIGRAFALEAIFLGSQGGRSIGRARNLLTKTQELAHDDPYLEAWAVSGDGVISYFEGRFDNAVATLQKALELWRKQPAGNTWEKNNVAVFQLLSLRLLGRVNELQAMALDQLRYARRRGDLYLETTVLRVSNLAWLCRDDAQQAAANLSDTNWVPPEGRYHLQHWWENEARAELALYEGRATEELPTFIANLTRLRKSLLTRVETVRIMSLWLDARLHLAAAEEDPTRVSVVRRLARALDREKADYAAGFAQLLHGALCERQGDTSGAIEHFRKLDSMNMDLARLLARRRVAQLRSNPDDRAAAELELRALGVADLDKVDRLFALA